MSQIETANKFVDAMLSAEGKLQKAAKNIETSKEKINTLLKNFESEQKKIINKAQSEIKADAAQQIFSEYKTVLEKSVNENANRYNEYLNATKFINEFEKMFIVSVFGKVKSGKSYLGNYIMGRAFQTNGIATRYDELGDIKITVYDKGKITTKEKLSEIEDGDGFGVDNLEATSTIQYFEMGGMMWIDTPGIGSITLENEQLAEEYIKNSDLVIFALNSDAAGTRQELGEIKDLYMMGKPMLIVVTQSDYEDEDIDDDGEIISDTKPKSEVDRTDVENYLYETLKNMGLSEILDLGKGKILTISTKLAVVAAENGNEEKYAGSNIDELIQRLIDITTNDAAKLKVKNPTDRFNKLVSELSDHMTKIEQNVMDMNEKMEQQKNETSKIKSNVISKIRIRAYDVVREEMDKAKQGSKGGKKFSGQTLAKNISDRVSAVVKEECIKGMSELIPDGQIFNSDIMGSKNFKVEDVGEKIITRSYNVEVVERRRVEGGFLRKVRDFFLGPEYESYVTTETRERKISAGDNSMMVESRIMEYLDEICDGTLNNMIKGIIDGYNRPLMSITAAFARLIRNTKSELEYLKIK